MADPYAGIGADPYAGIGATTAPPKRTANQDLTGFMSTVNEHVPGFSELSAALATPILAYQKGIPLGEAWKRQRAQQVADQSAYAQAHPIGADLARGTGWAAQAVPALATAGATAAPQAAAIGLAPRIAAGAATMGRNATVGGLYAAANGVGTRGTVQQRLDAGAQAIPAGMAVGAVAPPLLAAGGKAVGAVAGPVATAAVRTANKVMGGALLDPQTAALSRLGQAFRADKLTPDQITQAMNEWQRVGGPSPAFLDLVGENTKALIRGAASKGAGRQAAVQYGNRVAADAQDTAMQRTNQLTPGDQRPAVQVAQDLADTQGKLATEQYAQPYAQPVTMTPEALAALRGPDGHAAIGRAMKGAQANQDYVQMAELQSLLGADLDHPPQISAGALDRVKIAMGERGAVMRDAGSRDIGRGLFGRSAGLETALDATPGLAEARGTYRNMQAQRDALDLGTRARSLDPNDLAAQLADLAQKGPSGSVLPDGSQIGVGGAQQAAGIGMRSDMSRAIGEPADNATGILNRFGSSPNMGQRLSTAFGQPTADDYQQSLRNIVSQVNNARFINPNTGSQTFGRLADQSLVESIPTSKADFIKLIMQKLSEGMTLTDPEREAIVKFATGSPDSVPLGSLSVAPKLPSRRLPLSVSGGLLASPNNQ